MPAENGWDVLIEAYEKRDSNYRVLSVDLEAHEMLKEIKEMMEEVLDILRDIRER